MGRAVQPCLLVSSPLTDHLTLFEFKVKSTNTAAIHQITDALVSGDITLEDKHRLSAFNFVQVIRLLQLATE